MIVHQTEKIPGSNCGRRQMDGMTNHQVKEKNIEINTEIQEKGREGAGGATCYCSLEV